jgi:BirA family biotin operon repressor/biotin-[acetyl-CoA-carboxylase] ligase
LKALDPDAVTKGLRTHSFGRVLFHFSEIESTNDLLLRLGASDIAEGAVALAESQTRGRGRQGRKWLAAAGKSLAFSVLLRPRLDPHRIPGITLAAAVAVARALELSGFKAGIKWPNDVLLKGCKVCGILTEMGPSKDNRASVVLGVGLNVNQTARDFPPQLRSLASSLALVGGRRLDRVVVLQRLLKELETTYGWVLDHRFDRVRKEWRKRSVTLKRRVRVVQGRRSFIGEAYDIDPMGALLVRTEKGTTVKVLSGDVKLLAEDKA